MKVVQYVLLTLFIGLAVANGVDVLRYVFGSVSGWEPIATLVSAFVMVLLWDVAQEGKADFWHEIGLAILTLIVVVAISQATTTLLPWVLYPVALLVACVVWDFAVLPMINATLRSETQKSTAH